LGVVNGFFENTCSEGRRMNYISRKDLKMLIKEILALKNKRRFDYVL
jgi:hypothetical protein